MGIRYTEEELNSIDKSVLIKMFPGLQEQMESLTKETRALNDKMQMMMEQPVLSNKNRFGRMSEKMADVNRIRFMEVDGKIVFFNESEAVADLDAAEPEDPVSKPVRSVKTKGKRLQDMEGLETERTDHYMTEEELTEEFGKNGWKQLPDTIIRKYHFTPAKITVDEHHIGVYASKEDGHMKRAPHPKGLLPSDPVTASLAAAVMYDYLHEKLYDYHVIRADETPVLVNWDGRPAGSKSYMWVYRSGYLYADRQIVLYEYQKTGNASHPGEFLKNYSGVCVTDGCQVYHTVEKESESLKIA